MRTEANIDEWKRLYEIATEIKELKPWNYFWDMDVIYLKNADAYVSVLGRNGETYGISVYEGKRNFDGFKIIAAQDELGIDSRFAMYLQNNLTCYWGNRDELSQKQRDTIKELGYKYRGHNQWLYFMSYKKDYTPFNFDKDEVLRMTKYLELLLCAIKEYISAMPVIDFEKGNLMCYEAEGNKISAKKYDMRDFGFDAIELSEDKELISALKTLPKTKTTVEIDITATFARINDKAYDRPANPTICIATDAKSGMILNMNISTPEMDAFMNLANVFVNVLFEHGLPKKVCVSNAVVATCIENICDILGIEIKVKAFLPTVMEAMESAMQFMM